MLSVMKTVIPEKPVPDSDQGAGIQKNYFMSGSPPALGRWLDTRFRGHHGKKPRSVS